jgi:hypothetical protein
MRLRRDVLIAVLATFCLTSALFTIKPSGSQSTLSYNPWADINDDGIIDIFDLVNLANKYGTTGDPTKPVVINHNWMEGNFSFDLPPSRSEAFTISTGGYKTISICIIAGSSDGHKFRFHVDCYIKNALFMQYYYTIQSNQYPYYIIPNNFRGTFDITYSMMRLLVYNNSTSCGLQGNIYYYMST